ncbi:prenyltransferase [Nitrincola iocasae]|uniref:Prenyltransferase n=1 Tax=Nitrincola iocasae TaxID=2614693 RepID=A0A5J6LFR0_9GAMM|nr:prenyltransferase [Nitrincola iocasae]QEW07449.1 prenyltransferase [Nitrincola iocasae]
MSTDLSKYHFHRALRPFSFPVAVTACLVGIAAAYAEGYWLPLNVLLILLAGVLLQAGVNLINDYADLKLLPAHQNTEVQLACLRIHNNFRLGLACFLLAALIGLFLVSVTGLSLLWISLVGLLGALGYTLAPIHYKNRGLGVVMVFWLMGVLMITGSYLAAGAPFDLRIVWLSLPLSCLVALLLLSNELRDYESDRADGLGTLAVRLGYPQAVRLYWFLLVAALLMTLALRWVGYMNLIWPLAAVLLLLPKPCRLLHAPANERVALTPATALLLLGFGSIYCFLLLA